MESKERDVVIAILAKDKAHCIHSYMRCIYKQDYPKERIHLYIRTNNNKDNTAEILKEWVQSHQEEYASVYLDSSKVEEKVEAYSPHDWNPLRFKVLGEIRDTSVAYARSKMCHYFVVDCDNFVFPETLTSLLATKLEVVGPLLRSSTAYSNYHHCTDGNGYYKECDHYHQLLKQELKGLIEVDVIHCTYLIRYEALKYSSYFDTTDRHEYVRFSSNLRLVGIKQYLDNRRVYGFLTFADNESQLKQESWLSRF